MRRFLDEGRPPGGRLGSWLLVALLPLLAVVSCTSAGAGSAEESDWVDELTLNVAAVNDAVSLGVLRALPIQADGTMAQLNDESIDWPAMTTACRTLAGIGGQFSDLADRIPKRWHEHDEQLRTAGDQLDHTAAVCLEAAAHQSYQELKPTADMYTELTGSIGTLGEWVPKSARCPDGIENRPESCDLADEGILF